MSASPAVNAEGESSGSGRGAGTRTRSFRAGKSLGDPLFKGVTGLFAGLIALLAIVIIVQLTRDSTLSLHKFGFRFLTRTIWDPVHAEFGALAFAYGTAVSSLIAILLAVPLSVGIGVFLTELAPRQVSQIVSFLIQLLAAIPSVVYGLWGIFVLAPFLRNYVYKGLGAVLGFLPIFKGNPNGLGLLTSGLILAIMIVPIVSAITTDVLRAVPASLREGSLAMGATRWEATWIVIQAARSGICGAVILGLGRAIGETMAVTMVIGNRPEISAHLFDASYTISAAIANEFTEATSEIYRQSLVELGLVLFVLTFIINVLARLMVWSITRGQGRAALTA